MGKCEFIEGCPFFNDQLNNIPEEVDSLKEKYCLNNNLNCARYMVAHALGKEAMPKDLFPQEKERAYLVIAENS